MPQRSAEARRLLLEQLLDAVDPRLNARLRQALLLPGPLALPSREQTVVLAGHRSAGKTRVLPLMTELLGRPGVDLDAELERTTGRVLKTWVAEDPKAFRAAERQALQRMPAGSLVAVGGGFLSHHPDALTGCFTLIIPVSFETYRERLLADTTRPRLRPGLSLEEEISTVFHEREGLHARVPTVPLEDLLRTFWREVTP
ncbi:shikimate kinase [Stigmatella aurantiaca]|uniref:Shikimate kinase n=1 Tax=Stigmatella aurantiaca TaxID=41 RepID=A0A1H8DDX6_STIAU|nr:MULTISPECIES: shikimate kinase [Stigmatella]SEN05479.1 shikimate kinase [Stigmatella aurantiaca]